MLTDPETDGPPRAALIAALVVGIAVIAAVLVLAAMHRSAHRDADRPVAIAAVPAPHAGDPACRDLLDALPQQLGDYPRASVAPPAPDGAAAWRGAPDGEPVVLRCGLDRPAEFQVGSPTLMVDRVQWFEVREADRATWYAVDRPVYVALTLPPGAGPGPIQQLSEVIDAAIAAVPIDPAPAGG